jgi:hypothetical protein
MARANEQAWMDLEQDQANLQPTPPVGEVVRWYPAGDLAAPVAAQVTGIEGSGRLKLVAFIRNGFPQHKAGVYHVSAKIHQKPGNPTTKNWGSWDYVRGVAPDEDYEYHRQELAKRETQLSAGEQAAKKNTELFVAKQAEKLAGGKKPRLPDPLPAPSF